MSCRYAGVICRCRVVSPTVCPLLRSSLAMVVLRWFFIEVKLPQAMVVRERDHHALFFFLLHRRIRGFPCGKADERGLKLTLIKSPSGVGRTRHQPKSFYIADALGTDVVFCYIP